ncbi:hypothetical protein V6N11_061414 [Hibiscus sabdariffa]|uniref:Uncharacterized protein n=1 Tax=Hibiscus sabdariffa TaxID=183260 RepID=A0ABR2NVG7_9ROSI
MLSLNRYRCLFRPLCYSTVWLGGPHIRAAEAVSSGVLLVTIAVLRMYLLDWEPLAQCHGHRRIAKQMKKQGGTMDRVISLKKNLYHEIHSPITLFNASKASTSAANKCSQNMLEEETEKDGESSFVGRIALEGKLGLELEKQILH